MERRPVKGGRPHDGDYGIVGGRAEALVDVRWKTILRRIDAVRVLPDFTAKGLGADRLPYSGKLELISPPTALLFELVAPE